MDFSNVKKISISAGDVKQIEIDGVVVWKGGYKNWVPLSTDTDGSIYNGVGYKDNTRLSSSGGVSGSAQTNSVTTGFIPFGGVTDVVRMKGVEWVNSRANYGGHYYINFYDSNKKFLNYLSAGDYPNLTHVVNITRDENGVETVVWNDNYGTTNLLLQCVRNDAKFIRINAHGKGADMIVTINEEIT
jgi:hypothetical protein